MERLAGILKRLLREPDSLSGKALMLSAAQALGVAANVLTPIVLVRILPKADYGVFGMAVLILTTVHAAVGLNVNNAAAYFLPRGQLPRDQTLACILVFNAVSGLAVAAAFVGFPGLVDWMFNSPRLGGLYGLLALTLLVWNLSRAMSLVPIALGRSRVSAGFVALTESVKPLFVLAPGWIWRDLHAIFAGFFVWSAIRSAGCLYYFHGRLGVRLSHFDRGVMRRTLEYALPFGVTAVIGIVYRRYHHFLVGHYFDESAYAVFRVGTLQIPLLMTVIESTMNVVTPEMARMHGAGDHNAMKRLFGRVFVKLAVIFVPVFLYFFIAAEEFITVMFTGEYAEGVPIFQLNLFELLIFLFAVDPAIRAFEELKYFRLKLYIVVLGAMFVAGRPAIVAFGPIGAVGLTLLAQAVVLVACALRLRALTSFTRADLSSFAEIRHVLRGGIIGAMACILARLGCLQWVEPALPAGVTPAMARLAIGAAAFAAGYFIGLEGGFRTRRLRALAGLKSESDGDAAHAGRSNGD